MTDELSVNYCFTYFHLCVFTSVFKSSKERSFVILIGQFSHS